MVLPRSVSQSRPTELQVHSRRDAPGPRQDGRVLAYNELFSMSYGAWDIVSSRPLQICTGPETGPVMALDRGGQTLATRGGKPPSIIFRAGVVVVAGPSCNGPRP